jgi:hypothetical protein
MVAFSTVTPTAIVDGCPTGICTGLGQMWAHAGAAPMPSAVAVAATVARAEMTSRRTRERYRPKGICTIVPVRTRLLVPVSIALMLLLASCGGSSGNSATPTTTAPGSSTATTAHVAEPVSANPSKSAKMICETEAQKDIYESATGVKTTSITTPTWTDHVYSCDYTYPGGVKVGLSVKELSNEAETTAYFDSLATSMKKTKDIPGVGQGAFQNADGSVVVRKDYKVLTIDVSKLPAQFGVPAAPRGDVAINIGATIMSCWTGA